MSDAAGERKDAALRIVAALAAAYSVILLFATRGGTPRPPDALEYAGVARNLVRGAGYTTDMVYIHPGFYEQIRHPPELHGLLQPLLIAPLFAIFGPDASLGRVPGVLFVALAAVCAFDLSRRLFGAIAGFVAAALVMGNASLTFWAVAGSDDIGYALCTIVAAYAALRGVSSDGPGWFAVAGAAAAFSTLQKFNGVLTAFVIVLAFALSRDTRAKLGGRRLLLLVVPTLTAGALYAVRNYLAHKSPGFSFTAIDWLSKADHQAYFALYDRSLSVSQAWAKLGLRRLLVLTAVEVGNLRNCFRSNPFLLTAGPVAVLLVARRAPLFARITALYGAAMLGVVCVAYHVEDRYLAGLHPLLAVALSGATEGARAGVARFLSKRVDSPRATAAATLLTGTITGAAFAWAFAGEMRSMAYVAKKMVTYEMCPGLRKFVDAEVPPEASVLSGDPWFVSWDLDRPAVMAPTNGEQAVVRVANWYETDWALVGQATYFAGDLTAEMSFLPVTMRRLRPKLVFQGGGCQLYKLDRIAW